MEQWEKAVEVVLGAGPWAAFSILLLFCCVLLVRAVLSEARLNREAHIGNTLILTKLTTLIEEIRKGS